MFPWKPRVLDPRSICLRKCRASLQARNVERVPPGGEKVRVPDLVGPRMWGLPLPELTLYPQRLAAGCWVSAGCSGLRMALRSPPRLGTFWAPKETTDPMF